MKKQVLYVVSLISIFVLLFGAEVRAAHVSGSELTYTCVGNNQYEIKLVLYADCAGTSYDTVAYINLSSSSCNNSYVTNLALDSVYPADEPFLCAGVSSSCNGPFGVGNRKYVYSRIINIPAFCPDWIISWAECCRSNNISNLSGSSAVYTSTTLNNQLNICNSSPRFLHEYPESHICANDTNYLNFGAFDIDGDSLVYSFDTARSAQNTTVTYASPYTPQSPFSGTTSIDSTTGIVTVAPTLSQVCVLVVKVEEYRNGVKIGEIFREVSAFVFICSKSNTAPIISSTNGTSTTNGTFLFNINQDSTLSMNATTYDPEVDTGLQIMYTVWENVPNGATVTTGAAPTLNWTPTYLDAGKHFVLITLTDSVCPVMRKNTYAFEINVIAGNSPPNAIDDIYSVSVDDSLIVDILANDFDADSNITSVNIILPAMYGTATLNGSQLNYTPYSSSAGFLDTIIYSICDSDGLCDTASVYIIIDYGMNSSVLDSFAVGTTKDICFNTTGLSNISSIALYSDSFNNATILSYDLANGCMTFKADSITTDSATFVLCDNNGFCVYNTAYLVIAQGVWPGDTDTSQTVNNFDLLNIGLGYGNTGTPRNPASIIWDGYLTPDWTKTTPVSNVNFKHIDCNGDGIINIQDTVAIANNWNLSYTYNKSGAGTIPLYVDTISPVIKKPRLPIILGTQSIPANNVYGIAFTITYDTSLIRPNTVDIHIDTSWLGTAWIDLIKVHKDFYNDGMVQVAITRTDGIDFDGFGRIGSLAFTIQDDIMQRGILKFPFDIIDVKAIDENEMEILINPISTELGVIATNTNQQHLEQSINVFPNPMSNVLNIQTEDLIIEQVTLTNIAGQVVKTEIVNNNQCELYMQNLPNGIYTLSILTDKGLIHKKINVLK